MKSVRSPLLMNRNDSALLVVDVQQKLLPHIADNEEMLWNISRLTRGANILDVPVFVTEQYPKGLGRTAEELSSQFDENVPVFEKLMFSARECDALFKQLDSKEIRNAVLVGIETHVCVLQTAMDLMSAGYDVYVCIDAVGSRFEEDYMTAMQRMETSGAVLVSTEMTLFEWCETAESAEFKKISRLVQESFDRGDNEEQQDE